jgi:hypothetical protein
MKKGIAMDARSHMQTRKSIICTNKILQECFYADIAPLPVPFAEYQLRLMQKLYPHESSERIWEKFLYEVRQYSETAFRVLDDVVHNRLLNVPSDLRLSTEWMLKTLAVYDPAKTMPPATFKHWQRRGIIRMESHGKPVPASAAAVLIMRMMNNKQKENIFPDKLLPHEPNYWCNVMESLSSCPKIIPVNLIDQLPPFAIVWTPWAGAAWEGRWHIIGEHERNLAAIRFAGLRMIKGVHWWDVDLADIERWDKKVASLYIHLEGHTECQVQDLANVVLNRIFSTKVPVWNTQKKTILAKV